MTATATEKPTIFVRRPTAVPRDVVSAPTYSVNRPVQGLRVGLRTDASWRSWTLIASVWDGYLRRDGAETVTVERAAQIGRTGSEDQSHIEKLAAEADCAIVGLGTCGSCTSFTIADAVTIEKAKKPVVAVVTEEFQTHGHNMARFLDHGDLKILVRPYTREARPDEELVAIADEYYPTVLNMLGVAE
jgi:hypothetical protein